MCRIAYIPQPGLVEEDDLRDLFTYLEKKQGGDGNGLALTWPDSDDIDVIKGLDATTDELAAMATYSDGPALFHTRSATSGGVCDDLCQPFLINGIALAHNGVWSGWNNIAIQLILQDKMDGNEPINDSLTAAVMAAKFGRFALETLKVGVFIVMKPDGAWLHLRGGTFGFCPDLKIYASDLPPGWPELKPIASDSIAFLSADGPRFECGGWRTWKKCVYYPKGGGVHIVRSRQEEEDLKDQLPGYEHFLCDDDDDTPPVIHYLGSSKKKEDDTTPWEEDDQQQYLDASTLAKLKAMDGTIYDGMTEDEIHEYLVGEGGRHENLA